MKKRIGSLILAIGIIVSVVMTFTGCSFGGNDSDSSTLTAEEILEKITMNIDEPNQMDIDSDFFTDNYEIDKSILKSYVVRVPIGDKYANECAVFEVKDKKDIEKVEEGIEKRSKILENNWKGYIPEQYDLVKSRKVVTKGKYVLFVISENSDKIEENFEEIIE
ncbi:putative secreted protein [Clostridium bornimense]|uniref:Putative secreted protein n=1 Tax=Clostridium bornimense TaxID=1216932 RepID=W6S2Z9_9CLOT|nr:DUF4358 domain-containing protein [Clostridium bornimense]CDM68682.1 putative secreted protein [Clostridium bornimense]